MHRYTTEWSTPLHEAEMLAREGICTLDGNPLLWSRVAASSDDIWYDEASRRSYLLTD